MNSIHEASPLQSLPLELQVAICSYLKDIDLAIMELTCKHFKELLKDDLFWKENTPLSAQLYPTLSAKDSLLKNYRDYCNYFSEIFPELKEGPSLNAFQKKKQTDEVLKKSFKDRSHTETATLFLNIFYHKKELINFVVDVFSDFNPH
ncbi:F-box protein [Criblamydia sequanensis]|uniref:F-box domain-containing protein n=1 Tax=Candidatus Criblamydia sequanensis CRIB-18 TaxID=1437425 RepID=A0A090D0N7_9BACT|nr:F-box protein [Criblamydia sequanensis]CDR35107.1 F-box domain-containing protein [Criblamydia sequanensis CRIB-18]